MARLGSAGTHVTVAFDRAGDRPLTEQIACGLRDAVAAGRLRPGTRLPSTRALARDWDVSRNTVLHVFEQLVDEGLLESRVGAGTYVRSPSEATMPAVTQEPAQAPRPDYPFRSLSRRGRTLIDQNVSIHENPAAFMPDVPDPRAFPMRSLLRLMNEVTGRLKGHILVSVANAGYQPLRAAIAHHLRATRHVECEAADVIITTGSQQSLDLVSRLLLEPGDPVWLEEPGYIGARAALKANGCALHPCRVDLDGLDVELGRAQLPVPRMIFVSASRHYPLGVQLSPARRQNLLDFSRACGAWILEDDYDCEFRYDGPVLPALKSEDRANRVILIGTFSKTLLPSFRLGYIVAPPDLREAFARARAVIDRHAPILEQMVLAEFMQRGFYAAHLRNMRSLYRERQQAMVEMLAADIGYAPRADELAGGMHVVLPLKEGVDDQAVSQHLEASGVIARPLSIYYGKTRASPGLLLGFAGFTPEEIANAGKRLAPAISPSVGEAVRGLS